jgi:hypothetical protein
LESKAFFEIVVDEVGIIFQKFRARVFFFFENWSALLIQQFLLLLLPNITFINFTAIIELEN